MSYSFDQWVIGLSAVAISFVLSLVVYYLTELSIKRDQERGKRK